MQEKGSERETTFLTIYEGRQPNDWSLQYLALGVEKWYCLVVVGRVGLGAKEKAEHGTLRLDQHGEKL